MTRRAHHAEIMEHGGGMCVYCGNPADVVDHINPYCDSADSSLDNLVPACKICNLIAGGKVFESGLAKQRYILQQRKRRKWQARVARQEQRVTDVTYHKERKQNKPKPTAVQKTVARQPRVSMPVVETPNAGAIRLLKQIEAIEAACYEPLAINRTQLNRLLRY